MPHLRIFLLLLPLVALLGCNLQDPISQAEQACPQGCLDLGRAADTGLSDTGLTPPEDMTRPGPDRDDLAALDAHHPEDAQQAPDLPDMSLDLSMSADASCMPETTEAFCKRLKACGILKRPDNCGVQRQVDCGMACPVGSSCQQNVCVCPEPECRLDMCGVVTTPCGSVDCKGCEGPPTPFEMCWDSTCTDNRCAYELKKDEECSSPRCVGGVLTAAKRCGSKGECMESGLGRSCGAYACDGDRCRISCTDDKHCAPGVRCDSLLRICRP